MYRKIVIILFVAMLSYNVYAYAGTGKMNPDGTASVRKEIYDNGIQMINTLSDNEVSEKDNSQMRDFILDNEILEKDDTHMMNSVSDNGMVEKDIYIPDNISDNETIEGDDGESLDIVSNNESTDMEDEEESEKSVSDGNIDSQQGEQAIIKVSVPDSIHGWLDPENFSGKGGIYSDEYKIINYGNRDIVVKIKKIKAFYKEKKELYEFSEDVVGDEGPDIKKINIDMVWKNESENIEKVLNVADGQVDEYVLYLQASEYDENNEFVKLNEGSVGIFSIRGTLNQNPDIQWSADDIALRFSYKIQSVESIGEAGVNAGFVKNTLAAAEQEKKSVNEEY